MKRTIGLIGVVAMAMALMIALSGVASASSFAKPTPEKQNFNTVIGYDRTVTGDHRFDFWKSSSRNRINTENVKYNENMIGSGVATDFNKNFNIYTGTGDTSKWNELGLLPTASRKKMNAYSKLAVTDVQATTTTKVGMTDNPAFNYKIDAEGSNEGSMAKGRISAGMSVYVVGDPILSYEERSSASGSFQFRKEMSYTSEITTP